MVFLISWNVAGLSTTVHRIESGYAGPSKSNSKSKSKGKCRALANYMERHGSPDIVCFQEHKIPKVHLTNRQEAKGCSHVEGYESFWSCCVDDDSKGMNGVVTYAKKGTVLKANAFPFDDPKLDGQGRCVVTDHGKFVVFNVYVPASNRGTTMKMKFLRALRRAMQQQRQQHGKAVMLVGDLNISHLPLDIYWKNQVLHINDILQQVQEETSKSNTGKSSNSKSNNDSAEVTSLPQWKRQLAEAWPLIVETLKTKKAVPLQTTNPRTGAKFDRYRLCVTLENPTRTVYLGRHESMEDYCYHGYDFEHPCHYYDPDTDEPVLASEANVVSLEVVAELLLKIANIEWSEATLREIANSSDAGRSRVHPPRQWLNALLKEDNMVDPFRHFYPTAEARFTCWHQFTNTRYVNNGTRIDYTLVDRCLLPFVQAGSPLRTGQRWDGKIGAPSTDSSKDTSETISCSQSNNSIDPLSEAAALAAATARGQFQPVSFEGGGIVEATQQALDTQFGPRHTGMIYTPPSYSDHIAVSVLLGNKKTSQNAESQKEVNDAILDDNFQWRDHEWGKMTLLEKDPATKRAQPHKVQKSIASFFANGANTTSSKSKTSSTVKSSLPQKRPPPRTVRSFFQRADSLKADKPCNSTDSENVSNHNQNLNQGKGNGMKSMGIKNSTTTTGATKKQKEPPSILNHFAKK